MSVFLGIDGGGTSTTCVVGDEHRVLSRATVGGSNVVRLGETMARAHLHQAVQEACSGAGISVRDVQHVCAGVAGASATESRAVIRNMLLEVLPLSEAQIQVVGDMEVAFEGALAQAPGVVVMAGTGSIAFGRNEVGATARAGGWGWAISDEGSGHWIGRTAVAATFRAHDNGQPTALTRAVFREWGVENLSAAVQVANAIPGPDYSRLFPSVLAAAQIRDDLARGVLEEAGRELAGLAISVIRRLWVPGQQVRVAIGGSVFRHGAGVRQAFVSHLRREWPLASLNLGIVSPAEGALNLARRMAVADRARV